VKSGTAPLFSIIVPTLNEGDTIGRLLDRIEQIESIRGRFEIIVADDASGDHTVSEVRDRQARLPVRLLQRTGRPDLSASVLEAARMAHGQWVLVMDADGSHPVELIPELIQPLMDGRADITVGSRHTAGGGIRDWPLWRRWVSRVASLLAWPFTSVTDPMSGLFATRRDRLLELPVERVGYKILLELLIRTTPEPEVIEVPFWFTDRDAGASKMTAAIQWLFVRRLSIFAGAQDYAGKAGIMMMVLMLCCLVDLAAVRILGSLALPDNQAQMLGFVPAVVLFAWLFLTRFGVVDRSTRYWSIRLLIAVGLAWAVRAPVYTLLENAGPAIASGLASMAGVGVLWLAAIFYVFPDRHAPLNSRARWHLAALALIGLSLLLRSLYLPQADLIFDEMYYWTYNLYPALSYLDHPPLTAWLIAIGSALAGDTPLGVRLLQLLLMPLAVVLAYYYGKAMVDKTTGLLCAMLIAVVPAWFASGFLMITDAPQLVAWLTALLGFQRVFIQNRSDGWVLASLGMGLGMLSKYTIAFLAPAALLLILIQPGLRHWLWNWRTWLAGFFAVLLVSPVLIWNYQNDWASFVFQTTRRIDEDARFSSHWLVFHTLVMLAPLAGIAALYALGPVRKQLIHDARKRQFMLVFTLVPLAFLALFGTLTSTKFHWVMPIWLGLLPLIACTIYSASHGLVDARIRPFLNGLRRLWPAALPATLIAFGLGLQHVTQGLPAVPIKEYRLGYLGWPEIAQAVYELEVEVERQTGQRPIVAGMAKWGVSAALSFHDVDGRVDNITARNLVGLGGSQWERWFDSSQSPDRPVILIHHEPKLINAPWLGGALIGLGPLEMRIIEREGRPVQRLYYRFADGFRSEQLRYPGHRPE